MMPRAVIFDVYNTLLEVGSGGDAAAQEDSWRRLCREELPNAAPGAFVEFRRRCEVLVAEEHVRAKGLGVPHPEVDWPGVVSRALPGFSTLAGPRQEAFLVASSRLIRDVRLADGAGEVLRDLVGRGVRLGIASNAQRYTRHELAGALSTVGLTDGVFEPFLSFWSYENGFSKPDPHVFRILTARLRGLGIAAAETLMVGDREDNDVKPARAFGWEAWHFRPTAEGNWTALRSWIISNVENKERP